ncbi:MAG: alanine--tRNA ligase [Candidatus Aadella gelida]|nr:alanine--tRNA ligase [Candidatus Aadella gelida]
MNSNEIRENFLRFFEEKGHTRVSSDLLVPRNDPTLLFTGAGMNQFKDQFMGKNITYKRAASSQKCIRTGDVENVGKTPRHHTFFEMLGNFSFGDYFKKEAIFWGWEFMTKEMGIPEEKLWISVYEEDDESYAIWKDEVKIPEECIVKLGAEDNFWPADAPKNGPNGPCGPCSEIFYDWGISYGCGKKGCNPACDCGRFVEIWNLVFTEFERKSDGSLEPLPSKNIDTGMGLERITAVKQGVYTNFGTDLFVPILDKIKEELGALKDSVAENETYLMADHVRAAVFAICDGVSPSNEKQGYVIRKLIRRAYLKGRELGKPFLYGVVPVIADKFREEYPDLYDKREHVAAIVREEEQRFCETLKSVMPIMEDMLFEAGKVLTGEKVFKLVDTYGMPFEIIDSICAEKGISPDVKGFEVLMENRKEESRKGSDISCDFIFKPDSFNDAPRPEFSDEMPFDAKLAFILKNGAEVKKIDSGDCVEIVTSPQSSILYAESGGQIGDSGKIIKSGARMDIVNTVISDGRKILLVVVKEGSFSSGDDVTVDLKDEKKNNTAKNHTATHLIQAALRQVLGHGVKQSGSFVNDKRLRFDFTHMRKLSHKEIVEVQDMVNGWIEAGISVSKENKSIDEAKKEGALSFFGEKYGDTVRVVTVGGHSKELCGGTHVDNTKDIGVIKITGESSVASGIRRIEAVTSDNAVQWIKDSVRNLLDEYKEISGRDKMEFDEKEQNMIDGILGGKTVIDAEVVHDVEEEIRPYLLKKVEALKKEIKKKQKQESADAFGSVREITDGFVESAQTIGNIRLISGILENSEAAVLRKAVGHAGRKADKAVMFLGARNNGKVYLICAVDKALTELGINAKEIMDSVSEDIDGGGGGNNVFAQAGGKKPEGLEAAMKKVEEILIKVNSKS